MTLLLMGLRYHEGEAREVIRKMNWLRESVTYQAILEEGREEGRDDGRLEGERRMVLRLGTAKLGLPPLDVLVAIESISDTSQLERLGLELLEPDATWESLIASLAPH